MAMTEKNGLANNPVLIPSPSSMREEMWKLMLAILERGMTARGA